MFSADVVLAKHDFSPKNGPVPNRTAQGTVPIFAARWTLRMLTRIIAAKMGLSPVRRGRGQVHVFGRRCSRKTRFLAEKWTSPQPTARGLSQFSRRGGRAAANPHYRRENGTVPLAPRKGTGPCFRPTLFAPNTSSRRKMDQSPTGPHRGLSQFSRRGGHCACEPALSPRKWDCPPCAAEGDRSMFSADVVLAQTRFLAEKWTSPQPDRSRLPIGRGRRPGNSTSPGHRPGKTG